MEPDSTFEGCDFFPTKGTITSNEGGNHMDLIKIGKYIAGKRKELGMTQKQLAEKLGMSDKSVSKWERGVCLPDVSVYSDLCLILGISINEFLAGEDIAQENIERKSEENIIGVATDSKHKQRRLKAVICALLIISILAVSVIGAALYRANKPMNFIAPVSEDSVEMQTVKLLAGSDGANVYKFTTTDEYTRLNIYISEYQAGELVNKERMGLGFEGIGSPKNGEIIIVPDYEHAVIKLVISTDEGSKFSTELPIMEGVEDKEYYGRSQSRIEGETKILYDIEQPLVGMIYDNDEMYVIDLYDLLSGETDSLSKNDYMYLFSYEFCKE